MDNGEDKNILPFPGIETLLLNLLARNIVVYVPATEVR